MARLLRYLLIGEEPDPALPAPTAPALPWVMARDRDRMGDEVSADEIGVFELLSNFISGLRDPFGHGHVPWPPGISPNSKSRIRLFPRPIKR